MAQTQVKTPNEVLASNVVANIAATGNTELIEVSTQDVDILAVQIVMSADQALDAFLMQGKVHPDAAYSTITSAITATPGGVVLAASGTLASLAAGATGWALLDVRPFFSVRFQASAAVDGADVSVYVRGRRGDV